MTAERRSAIDTPRARAAIEELERLLLMHYPAATFEVESGNDDPDVIHLVVTVDVPDTTEVLDHVVDRMMEIQIEDGLPIFVIPVRPTARAGRS